MNDTTLASDNSLRFKRNILEGISKLIMTTSDKIRNEKLQCYIRRKSSKISVLSSGKIDKYEYVTGEKYYPLIKIEW